jgi:hypothetical protein
MLVTFLYGIAQDMAWYGTLHPKGRAWYGALHPHEAWHGMAPSSGGLHPQSWASVTGLGGTGSDHRQTVLGAGRLPRGGGSAVVCSAVQCSAVVCSAVHWCAVVCSAVHCAVRGVPTVQRGVG